MSQADFVLAAGGLLPVNTRAKSEIPLDTVVARGWRHPALDAPIVRVDLEALVEARDLEMQILGFTDPEDLGAVGKQTRRPLGFPGAAILADPKNARYALAILREFKKAARRASSKPGFAKDDFTSIGERLGKSVPHYLPSYYEEACRVFQELGNGSYAAQMFERARQAERVHALEVDETLRENTFVEFALAGALSIKSLTNYAKELEKGDKGQAYQIFRRVCTKRVTGGLPPFASMGKELKRLAKSAGLDVNAEDEALITELLDAAAVQKAPEAFFKHYTPALTRLAKKDPTIKRKLMDLFPSNVGTQKWSELLEKTQSLSILEDDAEPGWLSGWLQKFAAAGRGWRYHHDGKWLGLFERCAPLLIARNEALSFKDVWRMDPDLVDLVLTAGVRVEPPDAGSHYPFCDLHDWIHWLDEPNRGRDMAAIFDHVGFRPLILKTVTDALQYGSTTAPMLSRPGLRSAVDTCLGQCIQALKDPNTALPGAFDALAALPADAAIWAEFPHHLEALGTLSSAGALAQTLRIGIFDEHGWDTFDELVESGLESVTGAFPHAVAASASKAVVFGVEGRIAEFDLQLEKGSRLQGCTYVQGDLLVAYHPPDRWDNLAVWASNWSESFELNYSASAWVVALREDGALYNGGIVLSAGDRRCLRASVLSDGEAFWRSGDGQTLNAFDPVTGKVDRQSRPTFFESFVADGGALQIRSSWLHPLPDTITQSPLGQVGALTGFVLRVRDHSSAVADEVPRVAAKRIDGVTWEHDEKNPLVGTPSYLMDFPGHDTPRLVVDGWRSVKLVTPDGIEGSISHRHYRRGSKQIPGLAWWHALQVRDPAGSAALRAVTTEQVLPLVEAGRIAHEAAVSKDRQKVFEFEGTPLEAAVRIAFPEVTHPRLLRGLGGLAFVAGKDQARLDKAASDAVAVAAPREERPKDPPALAAALEDLCGSTSGDEQGSTGLAQIASWSQILVSLDDGEMKRWTETNSRSSWVFLLGLRGALAYRAVSDETPEDQRTALFTMMRAFANSPVAMDAMNTRVYRLPDDLNPPGVQDDDSFWAYRNGPNRYIAWRWYSDQWGILEWAENAAFVVPEGCAPIEVETRPLGNWGSLDDIEALENADRVDLSTVVDGFVEKTGLTPDEARMVAMGMILHCPTRFTMKSRAYERARRAAVASSRDRCEFLHAVFAADGLAAVTDLDAFTENLASAWIERHGALPAVSDEVAAQLEADLKDDAPLRTLRTLVNPSSEFFTVPETVLSEDRDGYEVRGDGVSESTARRALPLFAWLGMYAPVGSTSRTAMPTAFEGLRQMLRDPSLRFSLGWMYQDDKVEDFKAWFGGEPLSDPAGKVVADAFENEGIILFKNQWSYPIYARPCAVLDAPDRVTAVMARMEGARDAWVHLLPSLYSDKWQALLDRIESTPVPAGEVEVNPLFSVPAVVARVASARALSEDGAVYYLQLLTLPSVKDAQVRGWNHWSAARLKKARAELLGKELVVEAKRARAGRTVFLDGGWEALKTPYMPMETWKVPFYETERTEEGKLYSPYGVVVSHRPVHAVFEEAWKRIEAGDVPRYEEPGR